MLVQSMVIPPAYQYLQDFTAVIFATLILGVIVMIVHPSPKKVAILWVAVGIFQIIFSTFWSYPYVVVLNNFTNEVVYGLFILTCGIVLAAVDTIWQNPRRVLGLSFLLLGFLEFVPFLDFYFRFPNVNTWNITINATPSIAFLTATVMTLSCAVFVFWKSIK